MNISGATHTKAQNKFGARTRTCALHAQSLTALLQNTRQIERFQEVLTTILLRDIVVSRMDCCFIYDFVSPSY